MQRRLEMRERVGTAIEAALEKDPYNQHLQRQLTLVHNAQITTIDSFCIRILRDHFHKIDLEPGFRIADEGELKLLREDVCEAVLEEFYEKSRSGISAVCGQLFSGKKMICRSKKCAETISLF